MTNSNSIHWVHFSFTYHMHCYCIECVFIEVQSSQQVCINHCAIRDISKHLLQLNALVVITSNIGM